MNELVTKTLSHAKRSHHCAVSRRGATKLECNAKGYMGYETSPHNERDDSPLAAGRKAIMDEIHVVVGFSCCLGGQQRSFFCGHDLKGKIHSCVKSLQVVQESQNRVLFNNKNYKLITADYR